MKPSDGRPRRSRVGMPTGEDARRSIVIVIQTNPRRNSSRG